MTDPQTWVAPTYRGLADLLTAMPVDAWDAPSLCEKWLVRHVIAHVTMQARLTPEQFGTEMTAAGDQPSSSRDRPKVPDRPKVAAELKPMSRPRPSVCQMTCGARS